MPKEKKERTPAQIAAFDRMRAAQKAKILREAGVTTDPPATPPADPPPAKTGKTTHRARSGSKAKPRTKAKPAPAPAPAPAPSSGGGFLQGLREGFGT
jgi:hypothetical protein